MADGRKLILGVGYVYIIDNFKESFETKGEDRMVFGGMARSVTEAMNEINSGNYWGALISSLALSGGKEAKKYNIATKKFEKFDDCYVVRSGGLYVVEQACDRRLVTVVNAMSGGSDVLAETERLGAKCFGGFREKFRDYSGDILEYFQSYL